MTIEKERAGSEEGPFLSGNRYWPWIQRETPPNEEAGIAQATAKRTQRKTLPKMEEGQGLPFKDWWISELEEPEIANATLTRFHELARSISEPRDGECKKICPDFFNLLEECATRYKIMSYYSPTVPCGQPVSELIIRGLDDRDLTTFAVIGTLDSQAGFMVKLSKGQKSARFFQPYKGLINFISRLNDFLESIS